MARKLPVTRRGNRRGCAIVAVAALGLTLALSPGAGAQGYVGEVTWGTRGYGPGEFVHPYDVLVDDAGEVYVSDWGNHRIQVFDRDGRFLRMWGTYGNAAGEFRCPAALAFGPEGLLYVGDLLNARVQVFTRQGGFVREFPTRDGGLDEFWAYPFGLAVLPDGRVLVATGRTGPLGLIAEYASDGAWLAGWRSNWLPICLLNECYGMTLDGTGKLFVADDGGQIYTFDSTGTCIRRWACGQPRDVAIGPTGLAFVGTTGGVWVFTQAGDPVGPISSSGAGPWETDEVYGVAVTVDEEVYIADFTNHRIQRWGPAPVPTRPTSWGRLKGYYR